MRRMLQASVALLAVGVVLATAAPAAAQAWSGAGRVKGRVVGPGGEPVPDATVTFRLLSDRETGPQAFVTNKKGAFSFLGLRGAQWIVTIEAEGFKPYQDVHDVYASGATNLELELEPLPPEVLEAQQLGRAQERMDQGHSLAAARQFDAAREEFRTALEMVDDEHKPTVLVAIAGTFMQEGDLAGARVPLEQAIALDADHVPSLRTLCAVEAAEGDIATAEELLKRIPESEPVHPTTLLNIAMTYYNEGEMDTALRYLDRAVRDNPDLAQAYYFRGLVKVAQQDHAGALADFRTMLELEPAHPQAEETRGVIEYLEQELAAGSES